MYTVYWIKAAEFSDPYSQGYIGITSQSIENRFKDHKDNRKNRYLRNRCRKENIEIIPLHENLDEEKAKKLEFDYRPQENIGWNISKGGDIPPSRKGKVSPKSLLRGDERTEAQKRGASIHSEKMKGRVSPKRGKRYSSPKVCFNCKKEFFRYSRRAKYCSMKCSGSTNSNPEKKALLSEKRKLAWKKRKMDA